MGCCECGRSTGVLDHQRTMGRSCSNASHIGDLEKPWHGALTAEGRASTSSRLSAGPLPCCRPLLAQPEALCQCRPGLGVCGCDDWVSRWKLPPLIVLLRRQLMRVLQMSLEH